MSHQGQLPLPSFKNQKSKILRLRPDPSSIRGNLGWDSAGTSHPRNVFQLPMKENKTALFIPRARAKSKNCGYLGAVSQGPQLLRQRLLPRSCSSVMSQERDVREVAVSPFSASFSQVAVGWDGLHSPPLALGLPAVLPLGMCHKYTPSSSALNRVRSSTTSVLQQLGLLAEERGHGHSCAQVRPLSFALPLIIL